MRLHQFALSCAAVIALLSPAATARQDHSWACSDAVKEFCGDVQPGGGRILQCLQQHQGDLSPACMTASKEAEAHRQAFEAACGSDISSLCKGQDTGHGALWNCLKSQESQLSASCRGFTSKAHHEPPVEGE